MQRESQRELKGSSGEDTTSKDPRGSFFTGLNQLDRDYRHGRERRPRKEINFLTKAQVLGIQAPLLVITSSWFIIPSFM